jgi:hypothetical protein
MIAAIAGCGTGGSPAPAGSSGPSSTVPSPSATTPATSAPQALPDPPDSVAQQLCDQIQPQLSDWDVQGPTLGGAALNITVHQWALGVGGLPMSGRVLSDKAMIDRLTTKNCPDVRARALRALELPNLASGILF